MKGTVVTADGSTTTFDKTTKIVVSDAAPVPPSPVPWTVAVPVSRNTSTVKFGFNIHSTITPDVGSRLAQVGAKVTRDDLHYSYFNTSGIAPTPEAMSIINDQVARGIEPTLIIGIGPYPVPGNWGQFVTKVVSATKGKCVHFQCMNEPNWHVTPAQYFEYVKATYTPMKAANPLAQLGVPECTGIENPNPPGGIPWLNTFLALPNVSNFYDVLSFHPYYHQSSPEDKMSMVVDMLSQRVPSKDLAVSELGWQHAVSTGDQYAPASQIPMIYSRMTYLLSTVPRMKYVAYYELRDDASDAGNTDAERHYGVFNSDWSEKPWAATIRTAFANVHSATGARRYQRNGIWYVCMDAPSGQKLAYWTTQGSVTDRVWTVAAGTRQQVSINASTTPGVIASPSFPEFS